MMSQVTIESTELQSFELKGRNPADIARQLKYLRQPPKALEAVRPCTIGDGIIRFNDPMYQLGLVSLANEAVREGRLTDFVPASGAASRMFPDLINALKLNALNNYDELNALSASAQPDAKVAVSAIKFFADLKKFAFFDELRDVVLTRTQDRLDIAKLSGNDFFKEGRAQLVIDSLLNSEGLNYTQLPKALLAFHRYSDGSVRTALEEHLVNAIMVGRDKLGACRLHITRSPEHAKLFDKLLRDVQSRLEREFNFRFEITFSEQSTVTDTVATTADGKILRDEEGRIVFRAGGHGSLLVNLDALKADIVYINNIDNVQPRNTSKADQRSSGTVTPS